MTRLSSAIKNAKMLPDMTAERYLREIVEPTVKEYESEPTSVRRAMLACIVTFHAINYLGGSRQKFRNESLGLALVDRVANAAKHTKCDWRPVKAGDVISRPPGAFDVGYWDISRFDDPDGGVTILGETHVDMLRALHEARTFLRSKLSHAIVAE